MPSGKRARQQRGAASTPPPVRSKGAGGGRPRLTPSRRVLAVAAGLVVLVGVGVGLDVALTGTSAGKSPASDLAPLSTLGSPLLSPGPLGTPGPEAPPLERGPALAPASAPSLGQSVDGITCESSEQAAFHIHARLTIFVNGRPRSVPAGVGIANPQISTTPQGPFVEGGTCLTWLHTHTSDGIVHIESPVQRTYTLGDFFDIWGQPLSRTRVGPAQGPVTVLVDGRVWTGDPRAVPLDAHSQIQLEVGRPLVKPVQIANWGSL